MTKDELMQSISEARQAFDDAIAGLTDEDMRELPAVGPWTVKDVMAHLVAWEAETVTALAQLGTGARPRYSGLPDDELDKLNATWHAENKDRPLDRVQADYEGVGRQTLRRVTALSDDELFRPGKFKWRQGGTLAEWILGDTADHYREHAGQIREWRVKQGK